MAQALGIALPFKRENNGYFGTNYNLLRQLRSNIKNLIMTRKGERPMQPNFGCDVWKYVFEPHTPQIVEAAYQVVVQDVETWMPFLEIYSFNLSNTNSDIDGGRIVMKVFWRVKANANISDILEVQF